MNPSYNIKKTLDNVSTPDSQSGIPSSRHEHLDSIAGFLLVYMIYGHCVQIANTTEVMAYQSLQRFLYFFMAWFFFKSGMFHNCSKTFKQVVQNSYRRLLKPWCIYLIISCIISSIFMIVESDWNYKHWIIEPAYGIIFDASHSWNSPLWFLWTLFAVKILFHLLQTKIPYQFARLIILFSVVVSAFLIGDTHYPIPHYCTNILSGLFFYGIGYYLRDMQYSKFLFVSTIFVYAISFVFPSMVDIHLNKVEFGAYPLWILYSISACILINNLSRAIPAHLHIMSSMGKDSIFYYATHWIVMCVIYKTISLLGVEINPFPLALLLFSATMTLLCLGRFIYRHLRA